MYQKSSLAKTKLKYPSLIFDEPPYGSPPYEVPKYQPPTQSSYDSWIFKDIESAYKSQFIDEDKDNDKDEDEDNINHYKYEKQIVATLIKLLFHITLISIFETLFYFLYVSSLENNGIENAINTFINDAIEDCYNMTSEQIEVIDNVLDSYINASEVIQKGNTEELVRHKYNNHILNIAWGYVSGLAGLFVILSVYTRVRKIKINWKNVVFENFAMVILLGLYELLFFNTIVHKYLPISTQELAQGAVEKLQTACTILT
jgi:hypothetical protein